MPRRGDKKPRPLLGDPSDPCGMAVLVAAYLEHMAVSNYSACSLRNREVSLFLLASWLLERALTRPADVTKPILDRYQRSLFYYRKKDGQPLSFSTQNVRLSSVKAFFSWLVKNGYVFSNPASDLDMPRPEKRLPKYVLSAREAEEVLAHPDLSTPLGSRDRAILETLYSTGVRRSELLKLKVFDLDFDRGTVTVRQGKGKKDRVVPIGERALLFVEKYLRDVRPSLLAGHDEGFLFLTTSGQPFVPDHLTQIVREHVSSSGIAKKGSCHLFRHAMATLMLEGGADVRYVQEMLGHARLSTTAMYTHVSIQKLKEIHTATHPAAKLERRKVALPGELGQGSAETSGEPEEPPEGNSENGEPDRPP